jgi:hypothetical protein
MKKMNEETVIITKREYKLLKIFQLKLEALEQNGVDNWDWYGDAMETYHALLEEYGLKDE